MREFLGRVQDAVENDSEAVRSVLGIGGMLLAFAVLLFRLTSQKEPQGFRLFPVQRREWAQIASRAIILIIAAHPSAYLLVFGIPYLIFMAIASALIMIELRKAQLDVWSLACIILGAFVISRLLFPTIVS